MGAFFGSIQVFTKDRDAVKAALEAVAQDGKQQFLLGPKLGNWVAVYPDGSGQDERCATALAKRLKLIVLQLMIHDDDVFVCNYFNQGELQAEYCSNPDYFEAASAADHKRLMPRPEIFRDVVGTEEQLTKITRLLERGDRADKFDFEQERLEQFVKLLSIKNSLTSYEYLMQGERDGIVGWKDFVHIPDQSAEKLAKKAAQAALAAEKKRLQKEGVLCNEWLPPCRKQDALFSTADFAADALRGGFMVLWRRIVGFGYPPQLQHLDAPWASKPQLFDLSFASTNPQDLIISPGGNWLAFYDQGLRIFNWGERRVIPDLMVHAKPLAYSRDEKMLLVQAGDGTKSRLEFTTISLETSQVVRNAQPEFSFGDVLAVHPNNQFLVTRRQEDQFGIIDLETGKLRKVRFSEIDKDAPDFMTAINEIRRPEMAGRWKLDGTGRGAPKIMNAIFSPNGRLLVCATTIGLRVYDWGELFASDHKTPKPLFAVTPIQEALRLNLVHYDNYIYDVVLDEVNNRLLFCGIQGVIQFLNLKDGASGILLDPPGKSPIWKLELSHDQKYICCLCFASADERNRKPPRLQVWNYVSLSKFAGLSWVSNP